MLLSIPYQNNEFKYDMTSGVLIMFSNQFSKSSLEYWLTFLFISMMQTMWSNNFVFLNSHPRTYLERGRREKHQWEKLLCERETTILCLPQQGLNRNSGMCPVRESKLYKNCNLLVHRRTLNKLSHSDTVFEWKAISSKFLSYENVIGTF